MSNNKFKILVIEDEANISSFVETLLNTNGYQVLTASTCAMGVSLFLSHNPDLVILDLGLPDKDGLEFIKTVRVDFATPILVLSARTTEQDKVTALDLGANDYITKPFGTAELIARIRAALRSNRHAAAAGALPGGRFTAGGLVIDYDKYRVYIDGRDANLTQNEFKLVALLGRYAGRVLTYDYLIREIWGPNKAYDNQILRVNMANIRRKIEKNPAEPQYIFTEVGVGYRMIEGD